MNNIEIADALAEIKDTLKMITHLVEDAPHELTTHGLSLAINAINALITDISANTNVSEK